MLNLLSVLAFTILVFTPMGTGLTNKTLGFLTIFLVNLPVVFYVFLAFRTSHLWIPSNSHDNLSSNDVHDVQSNLISNGAHETQSRQALHDSGAGINTNDGSKYELPNSV